MLLRNKKTGEMIEGKCFTDIVEKLHEQGDVLCYGLLLNVDLSAEYWEEIDSPEPLIKNEKIRKAVKAWANSFDDVDEIKASDDYKEFWIDGYLIEFERPFNEVESEHTYRRTNIIELCGEEE